MSNFILMRIRDGFTQRNQQILFLRALLRYRFAERNSRNKMIL